MNHIAIALDGPGGSGKSTLAKRVAARLGYVYIDTGALYRTVGYFIWKNGKDPKSSAEVKPLLPLADISLVYDAENCQRMLLNGEDVTDRLRTPEMSMYASSCSALPAVREFLLETQRRIARENNVVMDGRDIGTVVLPDARVKVFLTASPEIRAARRCRELLEKGERVSFDQVLDEMNLRDFNDSHRAAAPLKAAPDSVTLDTSDMDLDEAEEALLKIISGRI